MANVNKLLEERLKKGGASDSKASALAKRSASGNLTGFAGIFGISELSDEEKEKIRLLLSDYSQTGEADLDEDFFSLVSITSEVKAINNQAAILHGERIKRAQEIFKNYRDGAFSAWLLSAYGNRQTPYNFLQYYEFYSRMPANLRTRLEDIPRQAVYTLASRSGDWDHKMKIIENYAGQTKAAFIEEIREALPIPPEDKRRSNHGKKVVKLLSSALAELKKKSTLKSLTDEQKKEIVFLAAAVSEKINLEY